MTTEHTRLDEARKGVPWRRWGPYLSERRWGTVRKDYSDSGNAWDYFTHDQARSRAYRRGENGIAGFSDDRQRLCFAVALWNGKDTILNERLFGLTNSEGNHGEDVKEYYYLDATPTHSYVRYLYKYPQAAYPYNDLVETSRNRGRHEPEYELIDTGVFDADRYFDVFVEYAKAAPEDVLVRVTVHNRGPDPAELHVLPTLWFRNTWSWQQIVPQKPELRRAEGQAKDRRVAAAHEDLGRRWLYCGGEPELLFTENATNTQRVVGTPDRTPYVKNGINNCVVHGQRDAVNPDGVGTKCAAYYVLDIPAGASQEIRLRLCDPAPRAREDRLGRGFDATFDARRREADEFYAAVVPPNSTADEALVVRQALAGMLWCRQHYCFDVHDWLTERGIDPPAADAPAVRNRDWSHLSNDDVVSMPDKWEYPWYAAWDLAFHCAPLAMTDGRRSDGDAERGGERQADQHDNRRREERGRESLATPGHHTNERSAS